MRRALFGVALSLAIAATAHAWDLTIWNEFARFTPDGQLIKQDWTGQLPEPLNTITRPNRIQALRDGYASLVLLVKDAKGGTYRLSVAQQEGPPVQIDLFRVWFHASRQAPKPAEGEKPKPWLPYVPDALVPIASGTEMTLPAADNRIPDQKAQMFWVDIFVPKDAKPRQQVTIKFTLSAQGFNAEAYAILDTQWLTYPPDDPLTADHNSYGMGFLSAQYPQLRQKVGEKFNTSDEAFRLMHEYYKIHYEHRGTLHNLGYGHNGSVTEPYAPVLGGYGENRRPVDWDLFDRHFGPLLDGSAFKDARRGPRPIPYLYLTINPEWPARYVLFGTQGYESEFVNAVREMIRHFEKKGWTQTKFEMFFNHKKRYKGFEWDGDETRWPRDDAYFKLYKRLLAQATPRGTPVQMIFRHDASWRMHEQWQTLNGVVDLWVCGGGMLSWFPWAPKMLHDRGNLIWFYGGTPTAWEPVFHIAEYPLRAWRWNVDGYCRWLTTDPGQDPWFDFDGGGTGIVYSGERFGIEKPIPSIRLKLERNIIQDIAILKIGEAKVADAVARGVLPPDSISQSAAEEWWNPTPELIHTPAMNWSNASFDEYIRPSVIERLKLDPGWWLSARAAGAEAAAATFMTDEEIDALGHQREAASSSQPKEKPHAH